MNRDHKEINAQLAALFGGAPVAATKTERNSGKGGMAFSMIFFSDMKQAMAHTYELVFELAGFADRSGFEAVWMPERHFHPFGGIYPNPSVLAAALAVRTERIRLRSGSVVLPLHHPIEVVEAWAMVDHLSGGRVDLGFASGWNPNDFVLAPDIFPELKRVWQDRIPMVRKLWRGETVRLPNGKGEEAEIRVYPKPVQEEVQVWVAISKSEESFRFAGAKGYNVLTMLQGIDLNELEKKIKLYRKARAEHGFDPDGGRVTLMLHTLVHRDMETVEAAVSGPFFDYIKSGLRGHLERAQGEKPTESEIDKVVEYSYERYFKTGALFGAVEDAEKMVEHAMAVGVNEIACLMDFGVPYEIVMESLPYLEALKERFV